MFPHHRGAVFGLFAANNLVRPQTPRRVSGPTTIPWRGWIISAIDSFFNSLIVAHDELSTPFLGIGFDDQEECAYTSSSANMTNWHWHADTAWQLIINLRDAIAGLWRVRVDSPASAR